LKFIYMTHMRTKPVHFFFYIFYVSELKYSAHIWSIFSICKMFGLVTLLWIRFSFSLWHWDPTWVMASSFLRFSRSHSTTHHSRWDSSGQVISSSQRPLPDNTQHSQQTNIHAPSGIRTQDLSRWTAADLCVRPRGYWDRLYESDYTTKLRAENNTY